MGTAFLLIQRSVLLLGMSTAALVLVNDGELTLGLS